MEPNQLEKRLKCIICGSTLSSPYSYHKHNIRQHSNKQLSRAILKLQHIQLPLSDPTFDYEEDDEEEERRRLEFDMADVLDLPLKYDLMDEEVIELGPTENADNLQVQSRLVKNPNDTNRQSRQIIEVQENHPPLPCYLNPAVEDPDAIIVKFNRELVMALDSSQPLTCSTFKKKHPNRTLRASFKTNIEVPDAKAFLKEFKKPPSSHDKYVMQSVMLMEDPLKRPRGRPKKVTKTEHISSDHCADPMPLSNEETSATLPNVTRSRSGRIIKQKRGDGSFDYYDAPGQGGETENLKEEKEWKDDKDDRSSGRSKRIRTMPNTLNNDDKAFPVMSPKKDAGNQGKEKLDELMVEVREVEEGLSMPLITHHIKDDTCISIEPSRAGEVDYTALDCLMCFKSFTSEEAYELHTKEHLGRDDVKSSVAITSNIGEKLLDDDSTRREVAKEEIILCYEKMEDSESHGVSSPDKEIYACSECDMTFASRFKFSKHSHGPSRHCNFCGKRYRSQINLQTHIKKYHKETDWMKFKCALCGKSFGFLQALERHMKEHNPNQKFCCEQCGKVFKNLNNLKNHIPLHTKELVFECPYCPKQYYKKYSYEKHLKTHETNPQYFCEFCEAPFRQRKQLEKHLKRHDASGSHGRSKDYKCNNCGDIKTNNELDIVGITDTGHHKTCVVCGKGLYKKYRYIIGDTGSVNVITSPSKDNRQREQCKLCGKFVLNLAKHIKLTHLGAEYVSCDLCGLVVTKASLASHKNRKHGSTKVNCDHCNQTFKNVMCLREHMTKVRRREDPSRSFCKFCMEAVSPESWKEHMTKHKRKCSDCGAAHFASHEEFLAHLDSCRQCSNCNLSTFGSREEFLRHIEICSSGIDVITNNLDSASEQEVVTSIFAIVDSNICEVCGIVCADAELLSQHISDTHPETLAAGHVFSDDSIIHEAILYACPKETDTAMSISKEGIKSQTEGDESASDSATDSYGLELGGRRYAMFHQSLSL